MPDAPAVQAERLRDLRGQVAELGSADMPEILFQHNSPGREPVTVYATKDGCPTPVPHYMLGAAMQLTNEDGAFRFVADAKDAPTYQLGSIKCFLHKDSPERPILEKIGLGSATCPKATLASFHSKRLHGLHRHKQESEALREFEENEKETKREARQDKQLEATLAIARGGATQGTPEIQFQALSPRAVPKGQCDICGKTGFKNVGAHKHGAHKEKNNGD
ncbi:hypothetical protein LCGC14_0382810 [marine sediment metagenome]|uniref:Uncharacterized protein n=1 Tax=marine sediment metagenome TaxID=412755 RepID=A0A0F9TK91_9ZZZZ